MEGSVVQKVNEEEETDDRREDRKGDYFWSKPSKEIRWRVRKIMEKAKMEGRPPVQFQRNIVWRLQKFNGKPRCKGWRLAHGVTTMGKAFYKGLWKKQDSTHPPAHCFSVKGRRREEGIAVQLILTYKLKEKGLHM